MSPSVVLLKLIRLDRRSYSTRGDVSARADSAKTNDVIDELMTSRRCPPTWRRRYEPNSVK